MDGNSVMITGAQARMARAALRLPLPRLAELSGVAVNTIGRFEQGQGARMDTVRKLVAAYQAAGVEFAPDGETVRFRDVAA
jgi:transcriptional regulator with XRE-family HTH domain